MHGFFDTDLHEVRWHFATYEAISLSSTDMMLIDVMQIDSYSGNLVCGKIR